MSGYAYDDYAAVRDELMARPPNDVIAELIALREVARVVLPYDDTLAGQYAARWSKKWGEK